jgi:hypothetical protein
VDSAAINPRTDLNREWVRLRQAYGATGCEETRRSFTVAISSCRENFSLAGNKIPNSFRDPLLDVILSLAVRFELTLRDY